MQLKWSRIAKCLSQKCYETQITSYKGEIKTIILIFAVPKKSNSNEEEKNYVGKHSDTNILTRER